MTKYTLSLLEYVSRWPKPRATDSVTSKEMENFNFNQIVCGFGLPLELVIENGQEFRGNFVKILINQSEISHKKATPYLSSLASCLQQLSHNVLSPLNDATTTCHKFLLNHVF